jgi:hypothetical protein
MQNDRDLRVRIINSPLGALTVADKPTRALEIARRAYEEYRSRSALRTVDVTFVIEGRRLFVLPYEDGRDSFRFMTKDLDPEPPILREGWVRPATPEKDLYFIAIGDVPPALMTAMVGHFERKFGISIMLLAPLSRDRATFDFSRSQLIADELIAAVRFRYATLARNPRTRVIGITADDMYMRATQATWR